MHPPLERPHPKCQDAINALNVCHAEKFSKIIFWKCNELKNELDQCFKSEKQEMLKNLNAHEDRIRSQEEAILERTESFQDFLQKDPEYQQFLHKNKGH